MSLLIGDCELLREARLLRRGGEVVSLSPKAFELLEILVDARPVAFTKEKLHEILWPDTFVSDASLHNLVAELRAALGDDPRRPLFIRTLHRYGYAFHGAAIDTAPGAASPDEVFGSLFWGAREMPLASGENLMGRASDCQVSLASSTVSRHHARIRVAEGQVVLEDLGSKNGTLLNGVRIDHLAPLQDGDEIRLGSIELTYRSHSRLRSTLSFGGP
jgi:DNA-binding winged helix-turn-helix (wHTH) protein